MCFAPQRRAFFRHLNLQKWREHVVFCAFSLGNVLRATTACTFLTSRLPKVVRHWGVLYIWTSKCASRHNGVHFFNISTSLLLRTHQFLTLFTSKCASRHNAVHFFDISTSKSGPKLVCVLYILTWKSASRHNGVQFFITHLARWLRTAALASLLFDPPEPQIIGKTQCFATFLPFRASAYSFFWLFLFSDLLSSNLSLLSASALLCFLSVHIVGSLTSKTSFDNLFFLC